MSSYALAGDPGQQLLIRMAFFSSDWPDLRPRVAFNSHTGADSLTPEEGSTKALMNSN
jgi:hypothetical protein